MNRNGINNPLGLNSQNAMQSMETYNNVFDKYSNPIFFYDNLNKTSLNTSGTGIFHFTEAAEKLLKSNPENNSYALLAFDIDQFSEINKLYGSSLTNELITHINSILKNHIKEPNLFCNINENFAILLENYKSIDIAMLVIQLSEEISCLYPELKIKLAFGICMAGQFEQKFSSLYKRAFYAKNTIKGQDQQLLANYTELL
jgi:GGDEF domain-containing protein